MLNVNIICVGKLKEKFLTEAVKEYSKRLSAFCKLSVTELDETKLFDKASDTDISNALKSESEKILAKVGKDSYVIAMCIEGKMMSSEKLSELFDRVSIEGKSRIDIIIGSSFGLSDEVKKRADLKLSVSPMTFPHQLFRVMLLEQVYRAFQISTGGKYHK
ncbi:MAG: 23S rRNA (pseudouridine(1915)-N(3))-methyltransferase RlmH [Ruminococcaceae bacterium]|nr:23S rRNA (pseudouridine(1915)-N(3))-methyltransferase RlmH [Oscillospiraceae bacterium]